MAEAREHIMNFKVTTEEMEMIRRVRRRRILPHPSIAGHVCIGIGLSRVMSMRSRDSKRTSPNT